jgi:hypothetical protein
MKRFLLFGAIALLTVLTPNTSNAQFALGDIAFTGYNSDGTEDAFSFVLLRNVIAGEEISFTENGWLAAGGFRTGESTVTLQFSGNYNCGSQIYISAVPFDAKDESGSNAGVLTGSGLALTVSGDQILAYDPANVPVLGNETGFVAAIQMNGGWDVDATSTNTSAQPSVFTDGVNSISIAPEVDNAQYNCSVTSGDPTTVLAPAIWNSANWNVDNTTAYSAPAPCTIACSVAPCNDPNIVGLSLNPTTVCDGDSSMLTIQGVLNDATQWAIYSGSCGGTLLGTTTGSTFMVQINAPSTDFFVRGEGGCVTPGVCTQISGFGLAHDDATFAYTGGPTYCSTDPVQSPTITTSGGSFISSPSGLSLSSSTGDFTPSGSTPNTYTVYYTTNGTCPSTDSTTITIATCPPPCNDPNIVGLSLNPTTVCDGDSSMLTIQGVLNDATHWAIYSGSCGGTLLGTTTGFTFMVQVNMPSTDFFVRGEGGCVTPGVCTQISGFGIAHDDATFTYTGGPTYCSTDPVQSPTITTSGGTFTSSPSGLSLSSSTGDFTPSGSTPNTYMVYYTTNGTCPSTDSVQVFLVICTNVSDELSNENLSIYPNPTSGLFTVNINNFNNTTLTVIDLLGKEVFHQNITSASTAVNLTGYNKGVYFIKIESSNGNTIKKIVIE